MYEPFAVKINSIRTDVSYSRYFNWKKKSTGVTNKINDLF